MRPLSNTSTILLTLIIFLCNIDSLRADRNPSRHVETKKRNTEHIDDILLRPDPIGYDDNDPNIKAVLKELRTIYQNMIRPVEKQFRYADLRRHTMSDVDIYAKPMVLLVGPWSTGKSTMINYLLGIEGALESLYVGAEPTTGDFTVLSYGEEYRTVEGVVLATDATKPFASMEKFGQIFLEHLLGVEMNRPLLRNISFIDTPGILENRRQQERGYPYNDVMRWLVHRSDLIFVVFDPTKLDVGYELETLFKQLKGKESVLRIILNKADSMSEQDLMRVYGALFWSLSPLINVTEPPRVYVGSFWGEQFQDGDLAEILLREEKSLLHDMREVVRNRVYNKIAFVRQYAIRVRIHALLVDSYVAAYRRNKGMFGSGEELARQIVEDPETYDVFKTVLSHPNISKYDLPEPEEYEEFFRINPLTGQRRLSEHCGYFSGCAMDQLTRAISNDLPTLLRRFQTPNERRGGKRGLDKTSDFVEWHRQHELKKKVASEEKEPSVEETREQPPETPAVPTTGSKKYRKTPKAVPEATPVAPAEAEEAVQEVQQEVKKKGRVGKVKEPKEPKEQQAQTVEAARSSKLSGKSKQKTSAEDLPSDGATKEQPKRKRRSKERAESSEDTQQTPPESEPEPPNAAPKVKVVPPVKIPRKAPIIKESQEETTNEPEPPASPPTPKVGRKPTGGEKASSSSKESPPSAPKVYVPAESKPSKKVSGEKAPKPKPPVEPEPDSAEQSAEKGHKGTTPPPAEGTKCNKYRKNCKEDEGTTAPVVAAPPAAANPEPPHKGTTKKSADSDKKKAAPAAKSGTPQPAPPPVLAPPATKCNKYRKDCQDGSVKTDEPVKAASSSHKKAAEIPAKKSAPSPSPSPPATVVPGGTKCNKYRKDCNPDGTTRPAEQPKKSVENPKEVKTSTGDGHKDTHHHHPPAAASPPPGGKKCNKYRKDCQQDGDEAPKKMPAPKEHHHQHPEVVHVPKQATAATGGGSCNKYRKSCQPDAPSVGGSDSDDDDQKKKPKAHEKPRRHEDPAKDEKRPEHVKPTSHSSPPAAGVKCNKYRKDCQQQQTDESPPIVTVKPSKTEKPDHKESKSKSVEAPQQSSTPPPSGKCNKYRKDCQNSATQDAKTVEKPSAKVVEKQKPSSSPPSPPSSQSKSGGGPCNKYRKSCRESTTDSESPPPKTDKASAGTKDEGAKPKKLCKKNTTAAPASKKEQQQKKPSSKSAPAAQPPSNSPAPVQQNKWRKQKATPDESESS